MLLENDPSYFLLRGPSYPPASERESMLGRIVLNFAQPLGTGYTPDDASPYHLRKPNHTPLSNAKRIIDATKGSSLGVKLSNLGSFDASQDAGTQARLENSQIDVYELHKQPEVFAKMMHVENIRNWVDQKCKPFGEPLYMVTGLLVWTDAKVSTSETHTEKKSGSADVPVGPVASAGAMSIGLPLDLSTVEDVKGSGKNSTSISKTYSAESNVSQIFAIQYKLIRKRKRDVMSGFPATFIDRGPRVEGDRTWGDASQQEQAEASDIVELDQSDVAWTEQFEDPEGDNDIGVQVEQVNMSGVALKFAYLP